MSIRLNRWQVIGMILSIIWFVGFAAWGWNDSIGAIRHNFTNGLNECRRDQLSRLSDADWAQFQQCLDQQRLLFEKEFESDRKAIPVLLSIDVLAIVFAWLVAWVIVGIGRWLKRRGFA